MSIKLIVGLGNYGLAYRNTRHNAGFWFLDSLCQKYKATFAMENKFFGQIAEFNNLSQQIILLKPETYMNLSGKAVGAISNFYKISAAEILVVHDELDFACEVVKLKLGGGNGGHNGLKSISSTISPNYWRLRIGIGRPFDQNTVADYVLNKPSKIEKLAIDIAINKALDILPMFLANEVNSAVKTLHT